MVEIGHNNISRQAHRVYDRSPSPYCALVSFEAYHRPFSHDPTGELKGTPGLGPRVIGTGKPAGVRGRMKFAQGQQDQQRRKLLTWRIKDRPCSCGGALCIVGININRCSLATRVNFEETRRRQAVESSRDQCNACLVKGTC